MNKTFKKICTLFLSFALLLQFSFSNIFADTVVNGTSDNIANNQTNVDSVNSAVYQTTYAKVSTMDELESKLEEGLIKNQKTLLINYTGSDYITGIMYGDLNGDKSVDSVDVSLLKSYLIGSITTFPSADGLKAADINGDGTINSTDLSLLERFNGSDYIIGILYGDLNGDKSVDSVDVSLLKSYLLGSITTFPSADGIKAADVNGDGAINSVDLALLKRFISGLITKLPATKDFKEEISDLLQTTLNWDRDGYYVKSSDISVSGQKGNYFITCNFTYNPHIYTKYSSYFFDCDKVQTVDFCIYADSPKTECKITVSGSAYADNTVVTDGNGNGTINITDKIEEDIALNIETKNGIYTTVPISFVKPIPPAKPQIKLSKENGNVVLRWDDVDRTNYYEVKRKTNDGEYVKIGEYVDDNFYGDADIDSGNKYTYIVDAVNSFGTSEDSNEVTTTYTKPMDYLGTLSSDKVTAFISESTPITFNIALSNKIAGADGIQLIDADSTDKKVVGIMYDDGNVNNGDSLKSDGIYSCKVNINEAQSKTLHLKAYISTDIDDNTQDLYSENTIELSIVPNLTQQDITNTQNAITQITQDYKSDLTNSNNNLDELSNMVLNDITSNTYVDQAGTSGGTNSIWYNLKSGIKCVVPIAEDGTNGTGTAISLNTDYENVKDTYPMYKNISSTFTTCGYSSNWIQDDKVSLDSFKNLNSNSAILINCHGGLYCDEPYICTGQVVDQTSIAKNMADLNSGRLIIVVTNYGSYYGVLPEYIKTYNKSLSNSVVFLGSCQGLSKDDMAKAFCDAGAKTVFGFSANVYKGYAVGCAKIIFQSMLNDRMTAGEAYDAAVYLMKSSDTEWKGSTTDGKSPARLVMYGDSLATLDNDRTSDDLVNGDFESGANGWSTDGNATIVSQYENIIPTSGNNMAILSDNVDSSIEQRIYIPEDAATLSFDSYGICENPVKLSINTDYQEGMEFELTNDDSGTINDTGYYSWQNSVNVKGYQGEYLTLRFNVPKYDGSAEAVSKKLIIDNVKIDGTPSTVQNNDSDDDEDDEEYLTWPTNSTRIILHNDEGNSGINIQGEQGDEAYAACDGEVVFAGQQDNYGNVVIVNSQYEGKNIQTRYSHLNSLSVELGDSVLAGDVIGEIGNTGNATGNEPILGFQILESNDGNECSVDGSNANNVDPEDYLFPYDQMEYIADGNTGIMGGNSTNTGASLGYAYVDDIKKSVKTATRSITVKYMDSKGRSTKDVTKAKTVSITVTKKNKKTGKVTSKKTGVFTVNGTKNRAKLESSKKISINIDDFIAKFKTGVFKYPGKKIDFTKKTSKYNADVAKIQMRLKDLGYENDLETNGMCGELSLYAVNKYKTANKISKSKSNYGIVDKATWDRLFAKQGKYKGYGGYNFSPQGEKLLKDIELPKSSVYKPRGPYFKYDSSGVLIGIRCQDVGDHGVTIGYGSYTAWNKTDSNGHVIGQNLEGLNKLKKYGITYGMSAYNLFDIVIPIEDCIEMMRSEIDSKSETLVSSFLQKPHSTPIKLNKQQFDALIIHKYLAGHIGNHTQAYLASNNGKTYDRATLTNDLLLDLKEQTKPSDYEKYKDGWLARINCEMDVFFSNIYKKSY